MEPLSAADHQLLASHYESVAGAEARHSSFGSMMAPMATDESLEDAKKAQSHHSPPFIYYHDPYDASLFHAEQSGTPDQPSPYDLVIAAVGDTHVVAACRLDHDERRGGDEDIQKMQLQQQAAMVVNKVYPKSEAAPCAKNMPVSSLNSSHRRNERTESSAGLDLEGSGTRRKQLLFSASITEDVLIKEKIRAHPEYHKPVRRLIVLPFTSMRRSCRNLSMKPWPSCKKWNSK